MLGSELLVVLDGVQFVLGHVLLIKVLPASSQDNIPDIVRFVFRYFAARLYDNLIARLTVVLLVVDVEVPRPGQPETNFVVVVIAADPDRDRLVHEALPDHGSVQLAAVGLQLDEAGAERVRQVENIGRHFKKY